MKQGEQAILCEGCGSKWLINASNNVKITVRLIECPLCENPSYWEKPEV